MLVTILVVLAIIALALVTRRCYSALARFDCGLGRAVGVAVRP